MFSLASLRSDGWTTCPELVDDFIGIRTQIKTLCDHCGNESFKNLVCRDEIETEEGNGFIEHRLYRCTICNGIILQTETSKLPDGYSGSKQPRFRRGAAQTVSVEQLWPPPLSLPSDVPERVRKIYEEARLVRRSPSSFVVQIGRALEAVTRDKQAEGRTLYAKLNWLIGQEALPKVFGQMGQLNRILRNWGAHDADIDVEPEDVEIVDEFFRAIIEYLYIAPVKVRRVQNLIEKRKSEPESTS